ncbi:MAG: prephenate dehydrogenase [Pirellulaceae bacterium]|nr:prephenate dehydrogenase [Pirellulaceae bacterium]
MQPVETISIVGVGLLGGALATALQKSKLAKTIVGVDQNKEHLKSSLEMGQLTSATTDLAEGVAGADVVIFCTPVEIIPTLLNQALSHVPDHTLFTDVGSVKGTLTSQIPYDLGKGRHFLGAHPLAGSEKSGPQNAWDNFFYKKYVLINLPTEWLRESEAINKPLTIESEVVTNLRKERPPLDFLCLFWQTLGGTLLFTTATLHDNIMAEISHFPHLVASLLAAETPEAWLDIVGPGWQSTTRVASGELLLWQQIIRQNKAEIIQKLTTTLETLNCLKNELEQNEFGTLWQILERGKQNRDTVANRNSTS